MQRYIPKRGKTIRCDLCGTSTKVLYEIVDVRFTGYCTRCMPVGSAETVLKALDSLYSTVGLYEDLIRYLDWAGSGRSLEEADGKIVPLEFEGELSNLRDEILEMAEVLRDHWEHEERPVQFNLNSDEPLRIACCICGRDLRGFYQHVVPDIVFRDYCKECVDRLGYSIDARDDVNRVLKSVKLFLEAGGQNIDWTGN